MFKRAEPDDIYYGQGYLILTELRSQGREKGENKKRRKLIDNSLTAVTVTARHNLQSEDGEKRELVQIRTAKAYYRTIVMPDAWYKSERKLIIVRKQTTAKKARRWINKEVFLWWRIDQ